MGHDLVVGGVGSRDSVMLNNFVVRGVGMTDDVMGYGMVVLRGWGSVRGNVIRVVDHGSGRVVHDVGGSRRVVNMGYRSVTVIDVVDNLGHRNIAMRMDHCRAILTSSSIY